ncbi:MAG: 6-bladed beta-propeller [Bacteroides sp.]|nr:6-bladed beta-propeller [Bacteroides sp.]
MFYKPFYRYKEEVYFSRVFNRSVYTVAKDSMRVAYEWDFGKDNYKVQEWGIDEQHSKGNQENQEILQRLKNGTIPYVIAANAQSDSFYCAKLVFGFTPQGTRHLFYRKSDGRAFVFDVATEDISLKPVYFGDNYLLLEVSVADIPKYKPLLPAEEYAKIANAEDDANPVLIKCYYKGNR